MRTNSVPRFVVAGQIARDLVLHVDGALDASDVVRISTRRELLGGKGANQAVALAQLGGDVSLVGVVGDDAVGRALIDSILDDGIDACCVAERGQTVLIVDAVAAQGERRLYEHVPADQLLTTEDVDGANPHFLSADIVCLQLAQPNEATLHAARAARDAGARVAVDGGVTVSVRDELLPHVDIVRADGEEASALAGSPIADAEDAWIAAEQLLALGPAVVALGVPDVGDLVAWRTGRTLLPFRGAQVVDRTGAGDAFFAALVTGLAHGWSPGRAGALAAAAAGSAVRQLGGRPDLSDFRVGPRAARTDAQDARGHDARIEPLTARELAPVDGARGAE